VFRAAAAAAAAASKQQAASIKQQAASIKAASSKRQAASSSMTTGCHHQRSCARFAAKCSRTSLKQLSCFILHVWDPLKLSHVKNTRPTALLLCFFHEPQVCTTCHKMLVKGPISHDAVFPQKISSEQRQSTTPPLTTHFWRNPA